MRPLVFTRSFHVNGVFRGINFTLNLKLKNVEANFGFLIVGL